jgi:outer membrane protein assembly factor BamA
LRHFPRLNLLLAGLIFLLAAALHISAQTRSEAEQKQVDEKAAAVKELQPDKPEQIYQRVMKNPIVKGFLTPEGGWTIVFGGLYPGSGFAMGPKYVQRGLAKEQLDVKFSAAGSFTQYYGLTAGLSLPHLLKDRMFFDVVLNRMDAPRVAYFGPGNDSSDKSETNFRLERTSATSRLGIRPFRRYLLLGVGSGYSAINTGPGQGETPSTETVFKPAQTPGLDRQSPYMYVGPFVQVDTRDYPGDPHKGANIVLAYQWFDARKYSQYSFRRFTAGAEKYVPFWNEKRVLVFRAAGSFSYLNAGQAVPFYMQQTVGGPDDVRGLSRFRYYGNNTLIANVEYRWEVAPALAMALFADAGRVSDRPGQMALSGMHGSAGIGVRFKSRNATAMRIDLGFSPEGVKFWWTFNDAFKRFFPEPF